MKVNLMLYCRTIQFSVFLLATVQILILHTANLQLLINLKKIILFSLHRWKSMLVLLMVTARKWNEAVLLSKSDVKRLRRFAFGIYLSELHATGALAGPRANLLASLGSSCLTSVTMLLCRK